MQTLDSPSVPVAAHRAPFDGRLFRRVLGLFPTGVTIVTTWDADGQPVGATVSSFNSVSLDPPLVLFSLARNMACCEAFAAGGPLAIHVLGEAQEDLSNRFARGGADKWADLAYGEQCQQVSRISGATIVVLTLLKTIPALRSLLGFGALAAVGFWAAAAPRVVAILDDVVHTRATFGDPA